MRENFSNRSRSESYNLSAFQAVQKEIIKELSSGYIDNAIKIVTTFKLSEGFILSPEVQAAAQEEMVRSLFSGDIYMALKIASTFKFSEEFILSPEVQAVAQKEMVRSLSSRNINDALEIASTFKLSEELVQAAAQKGMMSSLSSGEVYKAFRIASTFKLSEELVQAAAQKEMVKRMSSGESYKAFEIASTFKLSEELVQAAAQKEMVKRMSSGEFYKAFEIASTFKFSEEFILSPEVQAVAQKGMVRRLSLGNIVEALKIASTFKLSEEFILSPEVQTAAQEGMVKRMSSGEFYKAFEIASTFKFSEEFILSPEVQAVAQKEMVRRLSLGNIVDALNIASAFKFSIETLTEESKHLWNNVGLPLSIEKAIEIYKIDRFGDNLFRHFPEFDHVAKRSVVEIIKIDEETDSTIDRRSAGYRFESQRRLKTFERNADILKTLEQSNVDVEKWLNHSVVDFFTLGKAEELSFGQKVELPIRRLPESMQTYASAFIGSISEYKNELVNKVITEDTSVLIAELNQLEILRDKELNEKKRTGIEKGISSLKARIANPKEIRVWDKLHSEVSKLKKIADSILVTNNKLIEEEGKKFDLVDQKDVEASLDHKALVWKLRNTLIHDLDTLKVRMDVIFKVYEELLISVVGIDRAKGVMQQIQSEISEAQDHFQTDFSAIKTFIEEPKEVSPILEDTEVFDDNEYRSNESITKSLEGRPMSVRIGSRDRKDLYIGNYTTCCIRIDSDYHGSESPIADYVTDLGMQNVLVVDEVTKTPVACAWCWIGQDPETKETALVIDNIEGWQAYTVNFKNQLEQHLLNYLTSYSQMIGVNTLSQGPDYNDLDVIDPSLQEEKYLKLGGYNRANGYYLEAEIDED